MSALAGQPGVYVSEPLSAFPPSTLPAFQWVWPDAAARAAQPVTASQIGGRGYQLDIETVFELRRTTGGAWVQWGQVPWTDTVEPNITIAASSGVAGLTIAGSVAGSLGTPAVRIATNTNAATRLPRIANNTSAVAGNVATQRQGGAVNPIVNPAFSFRHRHLCVLGAVSASWRWFMGFYSAAISSNIDPGVAVAACVLGIGRGNGEANVQLYHGAQPGLRVDLGAAFPAATADNGYELILYSRNNNTDVAYQVTNIASGAVTSGVVAAIATTPLFWHWYCSNNLDASVVSLDPVDMRFAKVRL